MGSFFSNDLTLTLLVSGVSLLAVWVPFYRGMLICMKALGVTRPVGAVELGKKLQNRTSAEPEPISLRMLRVLGRALRENQSDGMPSDFVIDASRQYITNEYDASYARPISMYANILPPIGFIGTTGGLLILFLSMRVASSTLELGALAMALTSSIFALTGFAVLEALKIRLYGRMQAALDEAMAFYRSAASKQRGEAA
jgi:hypothetical protein